MTRTINLHVDNSDQLRDCLHETGLFEMMDCTVEVLTNPVLADDEINRIFDVIKSTINVVSTTYTPDDLVEDYKVIIKEVEAPFTRRTKK
jgi:hypothetical protein